MTQLTYNNASNVVRMEFPEEWSAADISALTLTIKDKSAVTLLAASAATLYTATSLDGAVDRFADEIVLDSGATALNVGDALLLVGVEGSEKVRVKGYDTTTYTATLERPLEYEYADNDNVYGLWATITVDTSVVATYTLGLALVFTWTPTGTGQPTTEFAQIANTVVDLINFRLKFERLFPRAYDGLTVPNDRLADFIEEAERQVALVCRSKGLVYDRIVEQNAAMSAIMYKVALLWTIDGDEQMEDERRFYGEEYDNQLKMLEGPLWQDHDQDGIEDDPEEVSSHSHIFVRSWR